MNFDSSQIAIIALLISLASLILSFIDLRFKVNAEREQKIRDEKLGTFNRPNMGLAIFEYKIGYGYPHNQQWFFIHPGGSDDYAVYPVRFRIYNEGNAATDDILITIQIPKNLLWKAQVEGMKFGTYPSLMHESIKHSFDEVGNFTIVSFALPPVSPRSVADVVLPFSFRPTLKEMSIPIKTEALAVTQATTPQLPIKSRWELFLL
jgi:hypothetical protein